jgi:16S rRNA (guanine527-N7)-methyltransferase
MNEFRLLSLALTENERARLDIYSRLLVKWQAKINLIGPATIGDVWQRHFCDSMQLMPLAGDWTGWVDLGSGGGFPGMVIAVLSSDSGRSVHLIESDRRKAAFLREVSRETGAGAQVHVGRIENILPELSECVDFDIVSARALAPLAQLIAYAKPVLDKGAKGLFLKGKGVANELTAAVGDGSVSLELFDSQTEIDAKIVVVRRHNSLTKFV